MLKVVLRMSCMYHPSREYRIPNNWNRYIWSGCCVARQYPFLPAAICYTSNLCNRANSYVLVYLYTVSLHGRLH